MIRLMLPEKKKKIKKGKDKFKESKEIVLIRKVSLCFKKTSQNLRLRRVLSCINRLIFRVQ